MIEPNYLNIKQLAKYSGLGVRTLRTLIKAHDNPLPHFRIGKKTIRISKTDFDNWMEQYRVESLDDVNQLIENLLSEIKDQNRSKRNN